MGKRKNIYRKISKRKIANNNILKSKQNSESHQLVQRPINSNGRIKTLVIRPSATVWNDWYIKLIGKKYSILDIDTIPYKVSTTFQEVLNYIKSLEEKILYDLIIIIPNHGFPFDKRTNPSFQWASRRVNVTQLYQQLVKRTNHIHTLTCYFGQYLDQISNSITSLKNNCYLSGFNSHIGYEAYIDKWLLNGCSIYHIPDNFRQKQFNYILVKATVKN